MIKSLDGKNSTFDKNSKGTVFTSGVGVVVLKRLSEAKRDGDKILPNLNNVDSTIPYIFEFEGPIDSYFCKNHDWRKNPFSSK